MDDDRYPRACEFFWGEQRVKEIASFLCMHVVLHLKRLIFSVAISCIGMMVMHCPRSSKYISDREVDLKAGIKCHEGYIFLIDCLLSEEWVFIVIFIDV